MLRFVAGLLLVCALAFQATAAKPTFTPLPGAIPTDISADGSVVVGNYTIDGEFAAFRWSAATGLLELIPPEGGSAMRARATSGDGSVVMGSAQGSGPNAFRWTADSGAEWFGLNNPRDISADGQVVVGGVGGTLYRWTADTGTEYLQNGPFPGLLNMVANAVSSDGTTIVGHQQTASGRGVEPIRWSEATGFQLLGSPTGVESLYSAIDASADGSTLLIVGSPRTFTGPSYFWTENAGYRAISLDEPFIAMAMSDDAKRVVGVVPSRAVFWDAKHGVQNLRSFLIENGLATELEGWNLSEAQEFSADGRTIAGIGIDPSGRRAAWVVTVPEPSTGWLATIAALGGGALAIRRRTSHATA